MSSFEQPKELPVIYLQPSETEVPEEIESPNGIKDRVMLRVAQNGPLLERASEISMACCGSACRACGPAQVGAVAVSVGAAIFSRRKR
jgi:hypothetical protein